MKSVLLYNCYPKTVWKQVTDSLLSVVPHDEIYEGNFASLNLNRLREPFLSAPCKDQYYGVERFWGTLCPMDAAYCAHYSKTDHYASRYPGERYKTIP